MFTVVKNNKIKQQNTEDSFYNHIPLGMARLCVNLDCNTVYSNVNCPVCGSKEFLFLKPILDRKEKE